MIERKGCKEFQETGLLLFVNQFLHVFGWAIVICTDECSGITIMYPARVKFRGFDDKSVTEAYIKLSEYMKQNSEAKAYTMKNGCMALSLRSKRIDMPSFHP